MPRTPSETASTASTPFSVFSSLHSATSANTDASEEEADLGMFTSVFRALSQLQSNRSMTDLAAAMQNQDPISPSSSMAPFSPRSSLPPSVDSDQFDSESPYSPPHPAFRSDEEEEDSDGDSFVEPRNKQYTAGVVGSQLEETDASTVWTHAPVTSYLSVSTHREVASPEDQDIISPTLGGLDAALLYIAKERARLAGKLDAVPVETDGDVRGNVSQRGQEDGDEAEAEDLSDGETVVEPSDSDSPAHSGVVSVPRSPQSLTKPSKSSLRGNRDEKRAHSQMTAADTSTSRNGIPVRVPILSPKERAKSLAGRLANAFPSDRRYLRSAIAGQSTYAAWSPTAPVSNTDGGPLLHVFIDHSNILIGFLEWFKRYSPLASQYDSSGSSKSKSRQRKKPRLSHTNLILLLERCRPCERRVLVASSPLYQNLDLIASIGYEVSVLQRVEIKESGNGNNGVLKKWGAEIVSSGATGGYSTSGPSRRFRDDRGGKNSKNKGRRAEHSSSESDFRSPLSRNQMQGSIIPRSNSILPMPPPAPFRPTHRKQQSSADFDPNIGWSRQSQQSSGSRQRRHREEAVDELLQLKFLQSLLDVPSPPPPGSTIVLATGDGASSQFNPDGFIGCVRRAVERGWRVELVGWEETTSRAWIELRNLIVDVEGGPGLTIIGLERWGLDLAEIQ